MPKADECSLTGTVYGYTFVGHVNSGLLIPLPPAWPGRVFIQAADRLKRLQKRSLSEGPQSRAFSDDMHLPRGPGHGEDHKIGRRMGQDSIGDIAPPPGHPREDQAGDKSLYPAVMEGGKKYSTGVPLTMRQKLAWLLVWKGRETWSYHREGYYYRTKGRSVTYDVG